MMPTYFVIVALTPDGMKFSPRYESFDGAFKDASLMLGNGAMAAWILDRDGSLVLPAEQIEFRQRARDQRTPIPRAAAAAE